MAFELYPTPSPPLSAPSIPFAASFKKFPGPETMLNLPLSATKSGAEQTVLSSWAYDTTHLYLSVETSWPVQDDRERAWRNGDGFLLTVTHTPTDQPTALYTSIGFGGSEKNVQKVVVNSCGRWFPPSDNEISYRQIRGKSNTIYHVSVPWTLLPPIRPLCSGYFAANLTYIRAAEPERVIYQLTQDPNYDTELTAMRNVLPLSFDKTNALASPLAQTVLTKARLHGDDSVLLRLGLHTPEPCPAELKLYIKQGDKVLEKYYSAMELAAGSHQWTVKWSPHRSLPSGLYNLEVEGKGSQKTFCKVHPFYVLNPDDLNVLSQDLERLDADIKYLHKEVIHSALFRLDWIAQISQAPPWELPAQLDSLLAETRSMLQEIHADNNPLAANGLSRRAFRSRLDGKLQPYSLYLPKAYSDERKWPLLVFLHGSGVDEQITASNQELHKLAERLGLVLLFPRGRNLSGFYLDEDEADILEALEAVKASVSVSWSRTFLAGFSMGGFGTWHTGLRHPQLFAGLAVFSGIPCLPFLGMEIKPGYQFDVTEHAVAAKSMPLLVVHGTRDHAVPIEATSKAVEALQAQGANITYRMLKAGHGNYDTASELSAWLKPLLKK